MNEFFLNNKDSIVVSDRILYTPSLFAKSSLLFLQEIGSLAAMKPHISSRSNLDSYLFFVVTDGKGSIEYNKKKYYLSKGDCVFIDCQKSYSHNTSSDDLWTLSWVHFNGASLPAIYSKYCERGGRPVFHPDNCNQFIEVWQKIFDLAGGIDYIRDMRINEGLNELLTLLMAESWHPEDQKNLPPKKSLTISVKDYLEQNYSEKISLDSLEKQFFINRYYLAKMFKEQYGQSINSYLLNVRITNAKKLLRFSDKPIEEIGLECGLGAPHYFSSKFKEVEGVPPSKYREQW